MPRRPTEPFDGVSPGVENLFHTIPVDVADFTFGKELQRRAIRLAYLRQYQIQTLRTFVLHRPIDARGVLCVLCSCSISAPKRGFIPLIGERIAQQPGRFQHIFKVRVDFDSEMLISDSLVGEQIPSLISRLCKEESLLPVHRYAR